MQALRTVRPRHRSMVLPFLASASLIAFAVAFAVACATSDPGSGGSSGSDSGPTPSLFGDDASLGNGASTPTVWPATDGAAPVSSSAEPDAVAPEGADAASSSDGSWSSAPDAGCIAAVAPGVLAIDELMIESVAGTGDYGEWVEVKSTSSCAINLNGLHGDCPVGTKLHSFDVVGDVWLLPLGTFVVVDSPDPVINHYLPGPLIPWTNQPGDVLRNLGGTITLSQGDAVIDTVTFPSLKPRVGATVAFPSDCPLSRRSDWSAWQTSTASWFPGFFGSPNAPNDDVSCR